MSTKETLPQGDGQTVQELADYLALQFPATRGHIPLTEKLLRVGVYVASVRTRFMSLVEAIWESRWVSEDEKYQTLVGMAAEIRSGNFDGIDNYLHTRLDAAEKESKVLRDLIERTFNAFDKATPLKNAGLVQCVEYMAKELTQLKERLSEVSKGTLMVENLRLKEANAAAEKELAAISAAVDVEYNGPNDKRSGDLLDDIGAFIDHHKAKEAELKQLKEANAELVKDKERLDWLQKNGQTGYWYEADGSVGTPFGAIRVDCFTQSPIDSDIRGAIDAAITKGT